MAEKYRFRQNSKISKEELRDGDIIPVEHDPSGINDRDRSLEVSTLVEYITENENNTNSLLDNLTLKEETPTDSDCMIVQESGAEETLKASTRRPISFIWEYIKNKISIVLGLTSETYNGKAATATDADHATNATNDASGNNIVDTYVNNDTLAQALEPFSGAGTGNGTASINTEDATQIDVSLDNFPTLINPVVGFKFRVVFAADYATDSQPNIKMNGGTAYPVTVGNVPAGIGAFQQDKSYEFIFTGTSYDCLSNTIHYKTIYSSSIESNIITLNESIKNYSFILLKAPYTVTDFYYQTVFLNTSDIQIGSRFGFTDKDTLTDYIFNSYTEIARRSGDAHKYPITSIIGIKI